ncbi:MAG TPA: hypothetical protein VKG61_05265, partial [Streptosporangiaceae bacterium]|nr:hypothetical protein [Streptosporangiaceae bacterium]
DLRPWVVAHALIGTHQSLIQFVRRRLADGPVDHARLAAEVAARGREALDQLEEGLARYAVRGPLGTGGAGGLVPLAGGRVPCQSCRGATRRGLRAGG